MIDSGRLDLEHARLRESKEVKPAQLVGSQSPKQVEQKVLDSDLVSAPDELVSQLSKPAQHRTEDCKRQILEDYKDGARPKDLAKDYGLKIADVMRIINSQSPVIAKHTSAGFTE